MHVGNLLTKQFIVSFYYGAHYSGKKVAFQKIYHSIGRSILLITDAKSLLNSSTRRAPCFTAHNTISTDQIQIQARGKPNGTQLAYLGPFMALFSQYVHTRFELTVIVNTITIII